VRAAECGRARVQGHVHGVEAGERRLRARRGSNVNDNPLDTHDHPEGVWTLPPDLALGERDRDKYLAIGESDRFTLKFVKPK
jgi:predicted methyltransferase